MIKEKPQQINLINNIQQFHPCNCKPCDKEFPKLLQLQELLYHSAYGHMSLAIPTAAMKFIQVNYIAS